MEIYTLDSLYRRVEVVDRFESMIWSERYRAMGDFELQIRSTTNHRRLFKTGTRIAINESYRVMIVETIEDKTESDGQKVLSIKGRSLEKLLDDRIALPSLAGTTSAPKWTLTGTPGNIVRQMFHDICVTGTLSTSDRIGQVIEGSIFPEDTIPESSDEITVEVEPATLYDATVNLCDIYDLGFRLVRNFDTTQLYWDVYSGSDRTTSQSTLAPVIFSPDLDNLQNTAELTTIASAKNVAYVVTPVGSRMVYPLDVDPTVTNGTNRQALLVRADDITDTDPVVAQAKMDQRGREELAKNRTVSAFDGELNKNSSYKYGRDYNLGDLVEMRNTDGITNQMRVAEQIFVQDREGQRSYPTLTINKFIQPGTWLAWDFNQTWEDLSDDPTTWAELP